MTTSRVQLALNVTDLEAATRFYTDLFGVEPAKQRAGYANFEIADPPLKLVLFENPDAASPLNHLGVEVASTSRRRRRAGRFAAAGLSTRWPSPTAAATPCRTRCGSTPPTSPSAAGSSTPSSPTTPAAGRPARPRVLLRTTPPTRQRAAAAAYPKAVVMTARGRRRGLHRRLRRRGPSTASTSRSARVRRSACSATTAPARPR